jgi:mycothiol system anti-sigma-R factor
MWSRSEDLSEISCDEVLDEIEHYLHGELDPISATTLAEHLGDCPPCLERAEFQRKLKEIVRAKCWCDTPESLVLRVQETIRVEVERGPVDDPGASV